MWWHTRVQEGRTPSPYYLHCVTIDMVSWGVFLARPCLPVLPCVLSHLEKVDLGLGWRVGTLPSVGRRPSNRLASLDDLVALKRRRSGGLEDLGTCPRFGARLANYRQLSGDLTECLVASCAALVLTPK